MSKVADVIDLLRQRKNTLRRSELTQALGSLGFHVRAGKKGNHRVVSHPGLKGFEGTRFDGGHGADAQIKLPYVLQMIKVIETWKDELEKVTGASP